jgi:cytoskeletal protein CcmA (bactofilin family)
VIEAGGKIHIPIQAQNVVVRGAVHATVTALGRLIVEATGKIVGDVQASRLDVQDGGVVSGACRILNVPREAPVMQPPTMPRTASPQSPTVTAPSNIPTISNKPMQ